MLAQNFKTADELKISEEELSAAISVLGMFERGEIVHQTPISNFRDWDAETPIAKRSFNMACSGVQADCGTIACIGGWMAVLMGYQGKGINAYVNSTRADSTLYPLFWLRTDIRITADQAATALRSYLTTGDARWDLAVQT